MPTEISEKLATPVSCATCPVGPFSIYGPTLLKEPQAITSCRVAIIKVAAQRTIMRENKVPDHGYTIFCGWAHCFLELSGGRRQILSFLIPGDFIPLESLCFPGAPLPYAVKALTAVSLCKFPLSDMLRLLDRTDEQRSEFRAALQTHCAAMSRKLADMGRRSAAGRLASLILETEMRLKKRKLVRNGEFDFPPRQEDIADALGLTPVHVNRTLMDLRRRGLIDFGREKIRILDLDALRQIAEEE